MSMKKYTKGVIGFVLDYGWSFFLGGPMPALAGIYISDWEWWAMVVPTQVLIMIALIRRKNK
jgi:hypothetical protein